MLGMRSCCTHPGSGERPHSPLLNPDVLSRRPAFDVIVIWRTQGYQLAVNSVTTLHRSQGQRSQRANMAAQRPAALPLMDLINSLEHWLVFLQFSQWLHSAGWGHQRPGNKGAALHSKDSTPVCSSPKKPFKKEEGRKRGKSPLSLAPEQQSLSERREERTSSHSFLLFSFLSPIVGEIIIGRPMNY